VSISIKQSSTCHAQNWWQWSVWLDAPAAELKAVDHVVYTLHPTFPDPVRIVRDRRSGFKLKSAGWGEFDLHLEIVFKDGKVRKRTHSLELADTGPGSKRRKAKRSAAREEMPIAYISSGSADAGIARRIGELLKSKGFRIALLEDSNLPADQAIDAALTAASLAVFVLSSQPSIWTQEEIKRAVGKGVPHIVPVVVGSGTQLPAALSEYEAIHLESPKDLGPLAASLADIAFKA